MKILLVLVIPTLVLCIIGCGGGGGGNGGGNAGGSGATLDSPTAPASDPPAAIAAGWDHAVILKNDGTVWAWGGNESGQLGNGTTTGSTLPVQVVSPNGSGFLAGFTAIAAGDGFTVALKNDGTVWTWGANLFGQLGDGTLIQRNTPVEVQVQKLDASGNPVRDSNGNLVFVNFSGATAIAAGEFFTVAIKNDGTVWAWGYNWTGQIGNGTTTQQNTAVQVKGISAVTAIAAGSSNTVALKGDGTVWTWGDNANGALGIGIDPNNASTSPISTSPVQVTGLSGVVGITEGDRATYALKSDGTVWSWGGNWYGELGNGTTTEQDTPVQVTGLSGVKATAISSGFDSVYALNSDGTVWSWGANWYGEVGNGTTAEQNSAAQIAGLTGVTNIAAGSGFVVVLKNDGTIWTWGANFSSLLPYGPATDQLAPVQVGSRTW